MLFYLISYFNIDSSNINIFSFLELILDNKNPLFSNLFNIFNAPCFVISKPSNSINLL